MDQLDLFELMNGDVKQIKQFIKLSSIIALLDQKGLTIINSDGNKKIELMPKHMQIALELFGVLWSTQEKDLGFKVENTYKRIKSIMKNNYPTYYKNEVFKMKDVRAELEMTNQTLQRHIDIMMDYGKVERCGGNKKVGFKYKISNWGSSKTNNPLEELEKAISLLESDYVS